ncbi:BMP family lipoprotein [Pseudaminobacter salicylatoxidans]|uniref:BMP family lipoprotein n=1 Tax=Pseudaminobacter salicylatoxidans TaxID=93369 RepID=UPI0018E077FF|nr:BMP family ABC transporter substrate-binding protein [Pseudaminobacter salicylatoxidans]
MKTSSMALAATMVLASVLGTASARAEDKPVALIVSQGGLGDQSYNDLGHAGFQRALKETGLAGKPVESKEVVSQATEILRRASDADFGLIVDLEYAHGEPMQEVARDYPDTKYVILNQVREGANIASVLFQEQEGSYLAGTLAALVTTDTSIKGINDKPVIGVIGGTKSAGIDKFIAGYIQGARASNPDIVVKVAYSNNFGDPAVGLQMAKAMIEEGADIIYHVAGGTGMGVIQAAREAGVYAIGVDTDQDGIAPGNVLTSMVKYTDVAVETVMKDYAADKFPGGQTLSLGLRENGVGLSEMKYTRDLIPAATLEKVEAAKQDILSGKVKVWNVVDQGYPDFMK